ncbi:MAG: lytic transglycosylase [Cycloclasticus sp. symbiont of Poecilosclerida sp. N]|nr:MAG: lytic transglycosylase [Cycloclasticus sp. symbiont of Poecilosclerida sp. N]
MQHLITNKTAKFLFFVTSLILASCTPLEVRPFELPRFNLPTEAEVITLPEPKVIEKQAASPVAVTPQSLWQRLFSLYQFPAVDNKRIQAEINWYKKHPGYLNRVQKNAVPYLFHIVNEIEKRGMPGELALLPIVESAYRPFAYSHGRAAGLWQFIPSTGHAFGLEQTWWYDGRRDVYMSSNVALRYLSKLAKRFDDDWFLALAGYNAGGGTVSSAIRRNKKAGKNTDFWSLSLRRETKHYVPKLIAIATVLANAEKYGIQLIPLENKPFFERVDIVKQIDLARAAELAGISIEELYVLNPSFNQWATSPTGPHYLLIPVENAAQFKLNLASLPDTQRLKWVRYKVKDGDTIGQIARRYRTTIKQIQQANSIRNHTIRADKHLLIPTANFNDALYPGSALMRKKAIVNTPRKGYKIEYRVESGDSFWLIAKRYRVSIRQLAKWNAMAPGDTLKTGQKLVIWDDHSHTRPNTRLAARLKNQTIHYTVKNGDSLYLISKKFKVGVNDLKRWNTLNKKYLKPGQKIKVIVDITRS